MINLSISFSADFNIEQFGYSRLEIREFAERGWSQWLDWIDYSTISPQTSFDVLLKTVNGPGVASIVSPLLDIISKETIQRTVLNYKILSGKDENGSEPDAIVTLYNEFDSTVDGPEQVMAHEFGHSLGFIYSDGQSAWSDGLIYENGSTFFSGPNTHSAFGAPVPIDVGAGHVIGGGPSERQVPSIMGGNSSSVTSLDAAFLADFGLPIHDFIQVNFAPAAVEDIFVGSEDGGDIDVLENDFDPNGDELIINIISEPAAGTVSVTSDEKVRYLPDPGFIGLDSFTYTVTDPGGESDTATVELEIVAPPNSEPIAADDVATVVSGGEVSIDVLANDTDADGDELEVSIAEPPRNGTLSLGRDGLVTYLSDGSFTGSDSFVYAVEDGAGGRQLASVSISVTPRPPITGTDGDDVLEGNDGLDDTIEGGPGVDVARYGLRFEEIRDTVGPSGDVELSVPGSGELDVLEDVEIVELQDGRLMFDLDVDRAVLEDTYRTYNAGLGRTPDLDGLLFWSDEIAEGRQSFRSLSDAMVSSREFQDQFPEDLVGEPFIAAYYAQILGRAADPDGLSFWTERFEAGAAKSELLFAFADSDEFRSKSEEFYDDGVFVL